MLPSHEKSFDMLLRNHTILSFSLNVTALFLTVTKSWHRRLLGENFSCISKTSFSDKTLLIKSKTRLKYCTEAIPIYSSGGNQRKVFKTRLVFVLSILLTIESLVLILILDIFKMINSWWWWWWWWFNSSFINRRWKQAQSSVQLICLQYIC